MNKCEEYMDEIRQKINEMNSKTYINSKGLPDDKLEENKLHLVSIFRIIEDLYNKLKDIENEVYDENISIENIFDKYASYVRDAKMLLPQYGISKVLLHVRSEEYFDAKQRGKISKLKYLYKMSNLRIGGMKRKHRRNILFKDIPMTKRYRKKLKTFSKEEIKKFYIIKYLDDLLIYFQDFKKIEYFSNLFKESFVNPSSIKELNPLEDPNHIYYKLFQKNYNDNNFNDLINYFLIYEEIFEKLLYNLKYLYNTDK